MSDKKEFKEERKFNNREEIKRGIKSFSNGKNFSSPIRQAKKMGSRGK